MASVFSKIISGEFSGLFAWADDRCVAFATIEPISAGHLLVVPRDEVPAFTQADDDLLAHLARVAKIIGRAQEQAFEAPRAALIIAGTLPGKTTYFSTCILLAPKVVASFILFGSIA